MGKAFGAVSGSTSGVEGVEATHSPISARRAEKRSTSHHGSRWAPQGFPGEMPGAKPPEPLAPAFCEGA